MKKLHILGVLALAVICMGAFSLPRLQYFNLVTEDNSWRDNGNLTVAQITYTALDTTTVDAWVDANTIVFDRPTEWNGVQFRWETTADADATTINIYGRAHQYMKQASSGATPVDDVYGLVATVALVGSTLVATESNVFADTATVTDGIIDGTAFDSGNNRYVVVKIDGEGFDRFVTIATIFEDSSTLHQHTRGY